MGWQGQPQQPGQCPPHVQTGGGPQQQLSVVTTVWGVKTNSQSGPMQHNYPSGNGPANGTGPMPPMNYTGQSGHDNYAGGPNGGIQMPHHKSYQTQSMAPRQPGPGYAGYE